MPQAFTKYFYDLHHWIAIRDGHPMREQNLDTSLNVMLKSTARNTNPDKITIVQASMTDNAGSNPYIYVYGTGIEISEELFYTLIDRGEIGLRKSATLEGNAGLTHDEFWEYYKTLSAPLKNMDKLDYATDMYFRGAVEQVGRLMVELNYAHNDKVPFETISKATHHYRVFVTNMTQLHWMLKIKAGEK